jgi:hypothetical protein
LHKRRAEHRQRRICNTLRLLKRHDKLGVQKAAGLFKKEVLSTSTKKVVNELAYAQLIADRAAKAEAKKSRKVFLDKLLLSEGKFGKSVLPAIN